MDSFELVAARKPQTEGFNPFELQQLESVEAKTDRPEGKKDFLKGLDADGNMRIMMADELSYVCQQLREEYLPKVKADNKAVKSEAKLEVLLMDEVGELTPLISEDGYLPQEGDRVTWANNPIGRNDSGIFVK